MKISMEQNDAIREERERKEEAKQLQNLTEENKRLKREVALLNKMIKLCMEEALS